MFAYQQLYPAFKKDLARLIEQVGGNRWLSALAENARGNSSPRAWDEQARLVDRIDEELGENTLWRDIRTAYRLHGTNYR